MASMPSAARCKRTELLTSRKASRANPTSPRLSSTSKTSVPFDSFVAVFTGSSFGAPKGTSEALPAGEMIACRVRRRRFSLSSSFQMLRQLDLGQPEIVDAPHELIERIQLHRLAEVAVRLQLIARHYILGRTGRGQDDRWNQFQAVIVLDLGEDLP